jgi:hypothetical protein
MVDIIPNVLADGFTINLKVNVTSPETLTGDVNMYDHQTLILTAPEKTKPDNQLLVFITPTLIDAAGNLLHVDDEMPFAKNAAPPQN